MPCPYPKTFDPKRIAASSPGWRGADAEQRTREARRKEAEWEAAEAARAARATAPLSLDPRTLTDSRSDPWIPEWKISIKDLDGYREMVALYEDQKPRAGRRKSSPRELNDAAPEATVDATSAPLAAGRDDVGARQEENWARTVQRSKSELRWKILGLKADRMWTLTARGGIPGVDEVWSLWAQFVRLVNWRYHRSDPNGFEYVVVPELHRSGGYHIHFVANRFYDVVVLRLMWHRVLTGERLTSILRGTDSPGNVDIQKSRSTARGLARYLAKYLGKTFAQSGCSGRRRFASSKHIRKPSRSRRTMPYASGSDVLFLRRMMEADGYHVESSFEFEVASRRAVWMACRTRLRRQQQD